MDFPTFRLLLIDHILGNRFYFPALDGLSPEEVGGKRKRLANRARQMTHRSEVVNFLTVHCGLCPARIANLILEITVERQ